MVPEIALQTAVTSEPNSSSSSLARPLGVAGDIVERVYP